MCSPPSNQRSIYSHVTYTDDVIGGSSSKDEEIQAIGELDSAYDIKRLEDTENGRLILGMK